MSQSAKVILSSVGKDAPPIHTILNRYPKFIHGEVMTHRVFSRNASSSRAIPVAKLIKDVMEDPAIPMHWGANQPGMQAAHESNALIKLLGSNGLMSEFSNEKAWLYARDQAVKVAEAFNDAGYHKQIVNRLIEPWCHINVVVTSTDWSNFFALRCHPAAQPEMRDLAEKIEIEISSSKPNFLTPDDWHTPFTTGENAKNISVARCARTSYLTQEGKEPTFEEDMALYDRLVGQVPLHASPAEHQARPDTRWERIKVPVDANPQYKKFVEDKVNWGTPQEHGNFTGWVQLRKLLPGECQ